MRKRSESIRKHLRGRTIRTLHVVCGVMAIRLGDVMMEKTPYTLLSLMSDGHTTQHTVGMEGSVVGDK